MGRDPLDWRKRRCGSRPASDPRRAVRALAGESLYHFCFRDLVRCKSRIYALLEMLPCGNSAGHRLLNSQPGRYDVRNLGEIASGIEDRKPAMEETKKRYCSGAGEPTPQTGRRFCEVAIQPSTAERRTVTSIRHRGWLGSSYGVGIGAE